MSEAGCRIAVVTLFPETIAPYLGASIPARAAAKGLVEFRVVQLRDFTADRHRTVDERAMEQRAHPGEIE